MNDLRHTARGAEAALRARGRIALGRRSQRGLELWTEHEISLVRQHYPDVKALLRLLPGRTVAAIRKRAQLMHLGEARRAWTAPEVTRLRRLFPTATIEELLTAFPGRTYLALYTKARKRGIQRVRGFRRTGDRAFDQVKQRCLDLKLDLVDLRRDAGCVPDYFRPSKSRSTAGAAATLAKAVAYRGGRLEVVWDYEYD